MEKIRLQVQHSSSSSSSSSCVPKITKPFVHNFPHPQQNQQWLPPKTTTLTFKFITISRTTNPSQFLRPNCRRWNSNAENFRTQNFNFNSKSQDDDDEDEEDESSEEWSNVLEEFIDQAWIFKVFRSYGWMLPAIIVSLLLASGLKAFLLTLAIPLAQSALSFAFQKVRGRTQNKRKSKAKAKAWNKTRGTTPKYVDLNEGKGERGRSGKGNMGNQTWAAGNDVIDKSREESPSFGGWEELDRGRDTRLEERSSDRTAEMKRRILRSKLSRRDGRRTDTPLLLRLLIAVFPFLNSWTRML